MTIKILDLDFVPCSYDSDLLVLADSALIPSDIYSYVKSLQVNLIGSPYLIFCGMFSDCLDHSIYAVNGIHPCELILKFEVGNYQGFNIVKKVYDQMSRIYRIKRFLPYGVDYASFDCIFEEKISIDDAKKINKNFKHGTESYISAVDELYPEDDDYGLGQTIEDDISRLIFESNEINLWWD
jgi:hypothetical protein